jgi:hypothetical protein
VNKVFYLFFALIAAFARLTANDAFEKTTHPLTYHFGGDEENINLFLQPEQGFHFEHYKTIKLNNGLGCQILYKPHESSVIEKIKLTAYLYHFPKLKS